MFAEQFFPTTIYSKDVNLDNEFFAKEIVAWSKNNEGLKKTNVKGWHSETNMHTMQQFKPLVDELFKMQHEVFKAECLTREPRIGNMWANINYPDSFNRAHIHPNSLYSGVYYIKTQPNCGKIVITDPRPGAQLNMPTRIQGALPKHLWRDVHLDAKQGRIIMFPSYLWHSVENNQSNDIRISTSFNFIQDGFQ